jgi:hypothetical protein
MKKKLLPFAFMALLAQQGSSQTLYYETFNTTTLGSNGASLIPSNMIGINGNNAVAAVSTGNAPFNAAPYTTVAFAVYRITAGTSPADTAAVCTSYTNPTGIADKWLITPAITGITSSTRLYWDAFANLSAYPDGYEVYVSVSAGASSSPTTAMFTGTTSNKVFTIAAEGAAAFVSHNVSLAAFAGQTVRIGFKDNSNDMHKLFIDDIKVAVPPGSEIGLVSVTPVGVSAWGALASSKTIGGKVINNGTSPITSFTAYYTDGIVNASRTFTGLNLAINGTYNFTITTPYVITAAAPANLKVYVNLTGDNNHTNDTLNSSVAGYSFMPNHKVVLEESTGTWCGWCVRGAVYMDSIANAYPNTCVPIAVHTGDVMANTVYDAEISALAGGAPWLCADRTKLANGDPTDAFTAYNAYKNDFGLADLSVYQTYNATSKLMTVTVNATMASSFTNNTSANDYRLAAVITENQVHGTATTYDQHNYYSGGTSGVMQGAGHVFQNEPDPVLAANMYYNFVARTILGGSRGQANSLPNSISAGSTYSKTYTYTVPAGYNVTNMKIAALIIDAKNNIIYNGNSASFTTGISSIDQPNASFNLYPNPATSVLNMDLNMLESDNVTVSIVNTLGQVVMTENYGKLQNGFSVLSFDINNLTPGAYVVNVTTSKGNSVSRFVK